MATRPLWATRTQALRLRILQAGGKTAKCGPTRTQASRLPIPQAGACRMLRLLPSPLGTRPSSIAATSLQILPDSRSQHQLGCRGCFTAAWHNDCGQTRRRGGDRVTGRGFESVY
jgi:hypothetical protein